MQNNKRKGTLWLILSIGFLLITIINIIATRKSFYGHSHFICMILCAFSLVRYLYIRLCDDKDDVSVVKSPKRVRAAKTSKRKQVTEPSKQTPNWALIVGIIIIIAGLIMLIFNQPIEALLLKLGVHWGYTPIDLVLFVSAFPTMFAGTILASIGHAMYISPNSQKKDVLAPFFVTFLIIAILLLLLGLL